MKPMIEIRSVKKICRLPSEAHGRISGIDTYTFRKNGMVLSYKSWQDHGDHRHYH